MKDNMTEELAKEADCVYIPKNFDQIFHRKMLVIVPDLNLSGSLTVLMEMLRLFTEKGYRLYIISSEDGKYREKMLELGIVVVIRKYVICSESYKNFLQSGFDCVFLNSSSVYFYIYYFINTRTKVIWWLHETKTQLETMQPSFPHIGLLGLNIQIAGVTHAVVRGVKEMYDVSIMNLPMPIADHRNITEVKADNGKKTVFFIPAAYTYIKGQDILLSVIAQLPKEYADVSSFVFCGYRLAGQAVYYQKIKEIAARLNNVIFLDELNQNEVYEWYQKCDCVVAPSRVDATPTTIIEGMMFERLCIVSDAAGVSEYMQDCENGFVFPSGNEEELLKRIIFVIAEGKSLSGIARKGRQIYEECFSVSAVWERLRKLDKELF